MSRKLAEESRFSLHDLSAAGLRMSLLPGGSVYAIQRDGILINQTLASPLAGGIHRIVLRQRDAARIDYAEIVGPRARSAMSVGPEEASWSGEWNKLRYRCALRLHRDGLGWFWQVQVEGREKAARCDVVLVQDVALATRGQARNNELFTAQYLDHAAHRHPQAGYIVMTRQNLPQTKDSHPWLMQGCLPGAAGFATDGFDLFGAAYRGGAPPARLAAESIGDSVRQYEAGYVAIQSVPAEVAAGNPAEWTFFARFSPNHPQPSSEADLAGLDAVRAELAATGKTAREATPIAERPTLFQSAALFAAEDLEPAHLEKLFPADRRHVETRDGRLQSFFYGDDSRHVVLRAKEITVARPHGHIMRSGRGLSPDSELLSSTSYAHGVFASQLALGNASLSKLLSGTRDSLNIIRSSGLRIFVRHEAAQPWELLGVPSAFEMALDECRWVYRRAGRVLEVRCAASQSDPAMQLSVRSEQPVELLISGEIAAGPSEYDTAPSMQLDANAGRITVHPDPKSHLAGLLPKLVFHVVVPPGQVQAMGGDELLHEDGQSRDLPYFAIQTKAGSSFRVSVVGSVADPARAEELAKWHQQNDVATPKKQDFWQDMTAGVNVAIPQSPQGEAVQDTLTWFARDALIHLSAPRGLEQASGGAWGVRDVCQGPLEFLLTYDHQEAAADILKRLFAQQYAGRRDWPQWFMFPPFHEIRSPHCHGDVLIWPLKAICDYLEHTGDGAILKARVPWIDQATSQPTGESQSILEHLDRLLEKMREEFLPGLSLPRYGEGDWDDSLQPADPLLRERMVSSWTTELMLQNLRRYAAAMRHFGEAARGDAAGRMANDIEADFRRHLMPEGVVAGFALFEGNPPRPVEYLLHPSDQRTGLKYRLIPMTRAMIGGIFSPDDACRHLQLLQEHLLFPDGARLMDRPTAYRGGQEKTFRRSESAASFGREIGLQYVHAHLRYAEAMAVLGRGDDLWRALLVVNPIAVTQAVPNARERQRNTYFSSSDGAFANRYEASRDYQKLKSGQVAVDGGWRVYSSGPGIYTSLVIRHLFGLRRHLGWMEFDPVLPRELDGASCTLRQFGRRIRYEFSVREQGFSPNQVSVNGKVVRGERAPHPYRSGGLRVEAGKFTSLLAPDDNVVTIEI